MSIVMNKTMPGKRVAGGGASSRQDPPLQETAMRRHPLLSLPLVLALAACVAPPSREAAYEQALSQWQGAPEDTLRARWGKPFSEEPAGNAKWLTYVVSNGAVPPPTVSFSIGGFGFGGGGHTSVGGGVGVSAPVGQATPITCTTRFLVENGKVSTWTFDGPGCGAP
jgi:hypothetical protein